MVNNRQTIEGRITTLKDKDGLVKIPISIDKAIIITVDTESNRFEKIIDGVYYPVTLMDALEIIDDEIISIHNRIDKEVEKLNKRIDKEVETLNKRIDEEVETLNKRIDAEVKRLEEIIAALKESLEGQIKDLEDRVNNKIAELNKKINDLEASLINKMAELEQRLETKIAEATSYVRTTPAKVSIGTIEAGKTKFNGTIIDALDRLFYPPIKPTTKAFNLSIGDQENGAKPSDIVLTYEFVKNDCKPQKVIFYRDNVNIAELTCDSNTKYSFTDPTQISKKTTYKVEFVCEFDAEELKLASTKTINYMNKAYWGPAIKEENIDSDFILGLANSTLTTSKTRVITTDLKDDNYFYYAIPTSFGNPEFYVGGFEGGFMKVATFNFVNINGYSESYDVWRTTNNNLGVTKIDIK